MWIDGAHVADEAHAEPPWSDDHDLLIGCDEEPGGFMDDNNLAGSLDEVRVYAGVLSPGDIGPGRNVTEDRRSERVEHIDTRAR